MAKREGLGTSEPRMPSGAGGVLEQPADANCKPANRLVIRPSAILPPMLKLLRYTLAAIFLVASVGCLALWWRSMTRTDTLCGPNYVSPHQVVFIETQDGRAIVSMAETSQEAINAGLATYWQHRSSTPAASNSIHGFMERSNKLESLFFLSAIPEIFYFPLWYPALVFALAGVAALMIGRRFTVRTALIATTVVAALLGMVVAL